eukprot:GHVQ01012771.1.p1 GENE.GHVQ01012771.1~~GHVQ01012771.1.p1  ORF type:complete len:121 (+),score=18.19 GHVQ01012771.1:188-550(+)
MCGYKMPASTEQRKDADAASKAVLENCKWAKEMYERCFNRWYRYQFLRGHTYNECDEYFDEYRACLLEELHKAGMTNIENFEDPRFGNVQLPQSDKHMNSSDSSSAKPLVSDSSATEKPP